MEKTGISFGSLLKHGIDGSYYRLGRGLVLLPNVDCVPSFSAEVGSLGQGAILVKGAFICSQAPKIQL